MYSLDINFLNDRTERPTDVGAGLRARLEQDSPRPLYIGVAIGIFFPALVLASWLLLQNRNAALQARQAQLENQLGELQLLQEELGRINGEITQINTEVGALATVFDRIKPWSAMLQNIRDNVPAGVQVLSIAQTEPEVLPQPAPVPAADGTVPAPAGPPEPPPSTIEISGNARSFNDVNDFLLTLQRSPFLNGSETRLVNAELIDDPRRVEFAEGASASEIEVQLPRVVSYTIATSVTELTASELLPELESTLAVGLTARIQALRDRGVLQP